MLRYPKTLSLAFIPSYLKSLTILRPSIIVADIMETILFAIFACILWLSRDRNLLIENLALRQQLAIMKQKNKRPKIRLRDRIFWVFLSRFWKDWKSVLIVVKPETVINWHRKGFKLFWAYKSRKKARDEAHLKRILTEYLAYYHEDRTHLGLGKETPAGRSVSEKPENGKVVAFPRLGGLHHRYEWQDAA